MSINQTLYYFVCYFTHAQTALKLLVGDDQLMSDAILTILQCHGMNMTKDKSFEVVMKKNVLSLLQDPSATRLLEVLF